MAKYVQGRSVENTMIGKSVYNAISSVGLMAASLVWALCLPQHAAAQDQAGPESGFNGPGRYQITNLKSGKALDLDRNDQTSVIQFSWRGTDNQMWDIQPADSGFYYLRNAMNGNALDAVGARNSARVRGTAFNGGPSQQWRLERGKDGNALIVSRLGKALDIPDGTNTDGAPVQMYDPNGDSNQRFTFRQVSGAFGGGGRNVNLGRFGRGSGGPVNTNSNIITCSSNNGQKVYCDADTSGTVRLVRQLNGFSTCRVGSTWGYDSRGIWVDRGCSAEFDTSSGNQQVNSNASIITCSSNNGRRVYCNADTSGSVRLVRQLSGSACQQDSTWGYDSRGIWVDRGCRGEFEVSQSRRRTNTDLRR